MQLAHISCILVLVAPATAQTWFSGNLHTALGQATLDDSSPGQLTALNLGAGGQDGMSIALGTAQGLVLGRRLDPAADAPGSSYTTTFASGGQPAGGHVWTRAGTGYDLAFDFTHLGTTLVDLELFFGGTSVQIFGSVASNDARLTPAAAVDVGVESRVRDRALRFAAPITLDVAGFGSMVGDELRVRPVGAPSASNPLTHADLTAAGPSSFTLYDEGLVLWNVAHRGLGDAHLDKHAGGLTVANIGSSGIDGVRLELGQSSYVVADVEPLEILDGKRQRVDVRSAGAPVGWAQLERAGGVLEAFADFTGVGAQDVYVAVVDYDAVFWDAVLPAGGPLVSILPGASAQPPRVHEVITFPSGAVGIQFEFDSFVSVTFPNGTTVEGPELHLAGINATSSSSAPFDVDFTARGTPSFTITRVGGFMTGFPFCRPATPHSGGGSAFMQAFTTLSPTEPLHLEVSDGPPGEFGYLLLSEGWQQPGIAVSNGFLCLTSPIARYSPAQAPQFNSIGQFDASGVLVNLAGTSVSGTGFDVPTDLPGPVGGVLTAGNAYYFQCWFRDGTRSNFSSAVAVLF